MVPDPRSTRDGESPAKSGLALSLLVLQDSSFTVLSRECGNLEGVSFTF